MTTIADQLELDTRDITWKLGGSEEVDIVKLFRDILSPLFRFSLDSGNLVIHHNNKGIGEEINTDQFIYFVMVLLKPRIGEYKTKIATEVQEIRRENPTKPELYKKGRQKLHRIELFWKHTHTIACVKVILDNMVIVLQGESYWDRLVVEDHEEDGEEECESKDELIKEVSTHHYANSD